MRFREIFRFEFSAQVRRVSTWLYFVILVLLAYISLRTNYIYDARNGDFFLNSPFIIGIVTVLVCQFWVLVAAAVAGNAAARDVKTGMHPLVYTTPISKADYLGGRFLAAFLLNLIILLAVPVGILLGIHLPGVESEILGPFRPAAYLNAFAIIALPNAFIITALQFSFAVFSRRAIASFLCGVFIVLGVRVVGSILAGPLGLGELANLFDPIGIFAILDNLFDVWTPIEKHTRMIGLEGPILLNRVLWVGIAVATLTFTHFRFRFRHHTPGTWWKRLRQRLDIQAPMPADTGIAGSTPIFVPQVRRTFGLATHVHQLLAIANNSFRTIVLKRGHLLLALPFVLIFLTLPWNLEFWNLEMMTVPLLPRTEHILTFLTAPLVNPNNAIWMLIGLLTIFYAEELVWKERRAGLSEIADAAPVPEWVLFLGKYLGLSLVLLAWIALLMAAGMLVQVKMGFYDFQVGMYLQTLFGLQLPTYLLFALLALVVHTLVNQKLTGRLAALIIYGFLVFKSLFGIEHNLLVFGAGPGWTYTEMVGFGPSLGPWLWFKLYWAAWALLLAVVARLFWVRSMEGGIRARFKVARQRLTRPTAVIAVTGMGLIIMLGGFIFYNTNMLNEYYTASERMEMRAEYERRYGQYENIPQPSLTGTNLHIEIYPERRDVDIRGTYHLVNGSGVAIDSIHLATEMETGGITFDRPAVRVLMDEDLGHRIFALENPLQPGDSLWLSFVVHFETHGFRNSGVSTSVVANGTYFTNQAWLPAIGYQPSRELTNKEIRREHGLPPRPTLSVYDVEARQDVTGGEEITFEAIVGTVENQIAVAPGVLRRSWTENGRRYFHYAADAPIGNQYAIFSADYEVHEAQWNDPDGSGQVVAIQIYRHPEHDTNVDHVIRSVQASLDYCTEQFGPYPHSYVRLIEYRGHGSGLHAESTTITHQEGFSRLKPLEDPHALDFVFAVIGHEMGHTCRGINYAYVEGAGLMTESLAWYRAMRVVEETYGVEYLRLLRGQMLREAPIVPQRVNLPLLQATTPYLSYRKGPFALYALSRYMGEPRVALALRRFHEKQTSGAPPATSLDLYRELQAVTPDSLQYLLHDLFEANIIWEFDLERASAQQTGAGSWQVTLDVQARKVLVDTSGVETELPIDDWVEIGVFIPAEEVDWPGEPLYLQKHRITSEKQTITVRVPQRPELAGIDPYDLLDWEDYDIEEVEIES